MGSPNKAAQHLACVTSHISPQKFKNLKPHEILLAIAQGEPMEYVELDDSVDRFNPHEELRLYYPTPEVMIEAAKAAAPYFAPRMTSQAVDVRDTGGMLTEVLNQLAHKLPE